MTTDEALAIVDQVGAAQKKNRPWHFAFQEAVTTLRVALAAKGEEVQAEPPLHDGAVPEKA